ncbi:PQQ-binding-like beta-propeller repeat protein [Stackebrandtia nassauensis]|uniref:Pyrrolo-quinoline quinone repeat domain-containing protein n=1 Tax=Stackebrandtia nassauensis (strain DSM 44728 / CIP 108903 / NRRL B-16338 / NBRC 102104 / LLR-40K-21) TaxID=446470 RepID=D3Q2S2_STANL|nr:PQQ-binding-like beta-propeller repeat protein [Stackebrandtia nassauensis]ADD45823.1 hypothetical protein Snas_6200 [Stackebrandtia nassauensis DSM 44728]
MNDAVPSPARDSARQRFSRALRRRGRRRLILDGVTLVVILLLALVVATNFSLPKEDPGPGWAKQEVLPEAEPVWTQGVGASDAALIHEDMLVHAYGSSNGIQATVSDLGTGDKVWHSNLDYPSVFLSGDYIIAMQALNGDEAVVYDIHSGKEVRTIKLTKFATVTVASGTLVSVEETGENDSRMRGFEVSTGKELWTKDLNKSHRQWTLGAPNDVWQTELFPELGIFDESTSPVVLLNRETASSSNVWDRVDAIDVATGEQRWVSPLDYGDVINPDEHGYMLTKSGDIFTEVTTGNPGDKETTSYVIDVSSGKETGYPEPADAFDYEVDTPLQGDFLSTSGKGWPQIKDVTNGKSLWRAKDEHSLLVHCGDVVFEEVDQEVDDPGEPAVEGVRVHDVATGKTLWTRQGSLESGPSSFGTSIGVGDDVVSTGFAKESEDEPPIQVFDRITGKGKWQIEGRLLAHNDDYFVFIDPDDASESAQLHVVSRKNPR